MLTCGQLATVVVHMLVVVSAVVGEVVVVLTDQMRTLCCTVVVIRMPTRTLTWTISDHLPPSLMLFPNQLCLSVWAFRETAIRCSLMLESVLFLHLVRLCLYYVGKVLFFAGLMAGKWAT